MRGSAFYFLISFLGSRLRVACRDKVCLVSNPLHLLLLTDSEESVHSDGEVWWSRAVTSQPTTEQEGISALTQLSPPFPLLVHLGTQPMTMVPLIFREGLSPFSGSSLETSSLTLPEVWFLLTKVLMKINQHRKTKKCKNACTMYI